MVLEDVILIRKPEKALLKHVSKCYCFFLLLFYSLGFRMCIFVCCFSFFFVLQLLEKKLSFYCPLILKNLDHLYLFQPVFLCKMQIFNWHQKKHTKAPVSLRINTLEEYNFIKQKDVQSNLNPGTLQSQRYKQSSSRCLLMSIQCCYDSLW